jgi:trk system potassium uptake protein TrkA
MTQSNRFAVLGLGRFGMRLARGLAESGAEVIAVDRDESRVEAARDRVTLAVALDSTDPKALAAQGIDKVDVAVVGIGGAFEDCALTTSVLKQLGVPRVFSRATTRARGEILSRIGADEVINPEAEAAARWSRRLTQPSVLEKIDLGQSHSIVQVRAPAPWVGKTLAELNLRQKHRVNVVAIRRSPEKGQKPGGLLIDTPLPDSEIHADDLLILVGPNEAIEALPKPA